jgi:hypothetical protein
METLLSPNGISVHGHIKKSYYQRRTFFLEKRYTIYATRLYNAKCSSMARDWSNIGWSMYRFLFVAPSKATAHQSWCGVVSEYANNCLNNPCGHLAAVSGVAQQVGGVCGGRYLAGLWSGDLLYQLLWDDMNEEETTAACHVYLVPSWSWAARHQSVNYDDRQYDCIGDGKMVDVDITLSIDSNKMGRVRSEYLIPPGRVRRFTEQELSEGRFGVTVFPNVKIIAKRFHVGGTVCAILLTRGFRHIKADVIMMKGPYSTVLEEVTLPQASTPGSEASSIVGKILRMQTFLTPVR